MGDLNTYNNILLGRAGFWSFHQLVIRRTLFEYSFNWQATYHIMVAAADLIL